MSYYRLQIKVEDDYTQIKKEEFPKDMEKNIYKGVHVYETKKTKLYLKNTKKYYPDFLSGNTAILIVSEKVKSFFEKSSEASHMKFIETEIKSRDVQSKYFIVNLLDPISCFDLTESIYEIPNENPDVIINFEKMVIDAKKTSGRKIFYAKEYPIEIFIEESLAKKMTEAGINDIELAPLINTI